MKVIYRGPFGTLFAGDHELVLDGPPIEISQALYERLAADTSIRLEVVETKKKPAPKAAEDDATVASKQDALSGGKET